LKRSLQGRGSKKKKPKVRGQSTRNVQTLQPQGRRENGRRYKERGAQKFQGPGKRKKEKRRCQRDLNPQKRGVKPGHGDPGPKKKNYEPKSPGGPRRQKGQKSFQREMKEKRKKKPQRGGGTYGVKNQRRGSAGKVNKRRTKSWGRPAKGYQGEAGQTSPPVWLNFGRGRSAGEGKKGVQEQQNFNPPILRRPKNRSKNVQKLCTCLGRQKKARSGGGGPYGNSKIVFRLGEPRGVAEAAKSWDKFIKTHVEIRFEKKFQKLERKKPGTLGKEKNDSPVKDCKKRRKELSLKKNITRENVRKKKKSAQNVPPSKNVRRHPDFPAQETLLEEKGASSGEKKGGHEPLPQTKGVMTKQLVGKKSGQRDLSLTLGGAPIEAPSQKSRTILKRGKSSTPRSTKGKRLEVLKWDRTQVKGKGGNSKTNRS